MFFLFQGVATLPPVAPEWVEDMFPENSNSHQYGKHSLNCLHSTVALLHSFIPVSVEAPSLPHIKVSLA
jgi:hypothetical protein